MERFDASINLLKEALKLDSEFPIIHTKLGILIMLKGMHFENDRLIEEGIKEYIEGMHIMTELGFKV